MPTVSPLRPASPVGALLQEWRRRRHKSQLSLATEAGVSARHLCFVETGRARPSREMVLLLAKALDVPLRDRNALLLAAGFAPVYGEADLDAPDLAPARAALDAILRHQDPYPAVVVNRHWDVLRKNGACERLFAWLLEGMAPIPGSLNLLRLMLHPHGVRPFIANWEEVSVDLIHRLHREALGGAPDERAHGLLDEVLAYPNVPAGLGRPLVSQPIVPVVPVIFEKGAMRFEYFSTVTTLGTPQDITLQEIRIECLFPLNAETAENARRLAAASIEAVERPARAASASMS